MRKPDGTIETKIDPVKNHGIWTKIPLVLCAISMIESLIVGYRYMMYSAQVLSLIHISSTLTATAATPAASRSALAAATQLRWQFWSSSDLL